MAQITRTGTPTEEQVEAGVVRPASGVELRTAVRWGLIGGGTGAFLSATGMVQSFARRQVVNPSLTLGYLVLFLVPFTFGYVAGSPPPVLEGQEAPRRGIRNVVAGALAGAITGLVLVLFALFFSAVNLRSVFVNISPALMQVLTFGQGLAIGSLILVVGGVLLGALGGAVHVIPERWRGPAIHALLWVLTVGLLRDLVGQIFRGIGLSSVNRIFFAPGGGLTLTGAALVAVSIFALSAYLEARRGPSLRKKVESLSRAERVRWGAIAIAITMVVIALTPVVMGRFMSEILDLVGVFLLMALGLNIVVGYAGLLDLGYVAFFAVGAYMTALLTSSASPGFSPELTFWLALPFVMLAAAFSGVIVGTPVLRMRGDYLAIVTLGFGEIARILFLSDWFKPNFGGAQGITRIPGISMGAIVLRSPQDFFYPIAFLVLVAAYISWALSHSRIGRAWMAMREDEPVAEVMGINIVTAKLSAFIIGAVLASFAGAVFASKTGAIFPTSFSIVVSIIVLVVIIVGGMGSIPGVAVGALVIQGIPQLLREFEEFQFLLYGALLIFMMLFKPEGLVPSRRRAQELHQEELLQDAWLTGTQQDREVAASSPEADPDRGLV